MYELVKIFGKLPDDPFFEEMNPTTKLWLYESWIHSLEIEYEKLRHLGILIGSFYNPDAARKMSQKENPDYSTTEEEFNESVRMVREFVQQQEEQQGQGKRRKKRKVISNG